MLRDGIVRSQSRTAVANPVPNGRLNLPESVVPSHPHMRRSVNFGMALAWLSAAPGSAARPPAATLGPRRWPLALAIGAVAATVFVIRRDRRALVYALALPALFLAAGARYDATRPHIAPGDAARFNDGVAMRIRVVLRDDPTSATRRSGSPRTVRAVQIDGEWQPGVGRRAGADRPATPATARATCSSWRACSRSPPRLDGFDYADYLARRGIQSTMTSPSARLVGHEDDSLVHATILHVRRTLSRSLALALPEPQASLAQGVLLGQRSALPPDLAADLNTTNTSHLVVVSGSNVVYVSAFATMLFGWFAGRRRGRLLSIVAIVAYTMLIGPSPPVVRALIMGVLVVLAGVVGRRGSTATALLVAAAIMVGLDAQTVRDVSFQLSFASAAGILYVAAPMRRWIIEALARAFRVDELPHWTGLVVEPFAMTAAAVLATAPLLALSFGRLSLDRPARERARRAGVPAHPRDVAGGGAGRAAAGVPAADRGAGVLRTHVLDRCCALARVGAARRRGD